MGVIIGCGNRYSYLMQKQRLCPEFDLPSFRGLARRSSVPLGSRGKGAFCNSPEVKVTSSSTLTAKTGSEFFYK
jgi:hypothetical protein